MVESSRPPRPTSITAMSTAWSAKYLNAIAVNISKYVGSHRARAAALATCCVRSQKSLRLMSWPFIVMRSRRSIRWGLVNCPTA